MPTSEYWNQVDWPEACLAMEKKLGRPWTRLYPLMEDNPLKPKKALDVQTPKGKGILAQVFEGRAMVLLFKTKKRESARGIAKNEYRPMTAFLPEQVRPTAASIRRLNNS